MAAGGRPEPLGAGGPAACDARPPLASVVKSWSMLACAALRGLKSLTSHCSRRSRKGGCQNDSRAYNKSGTRKPTIVRSYAFQNQNQHG